MTDSEAREMARGLVRGSIIEDAASQFIAQVLKEAHDSRIKPLRDRIEELEAKLSQQNDLVQAAVAAALREADEAVQSVASNCTTEDGHVAIIAAVEKVRFLITEDAQAALDRAKAAAETRGYQKGYAARSGMPTLSTRPVIYSVRE